MRTKRQMWNPFRKKTKAISQEDIKTAVDTHGHYIDLQEYIAQHKAIPLMWGNGFELTGNDGFSKDRLQKIFDKNGISGLFIHSEEVLSKRQDGNQLWIVQPNTDRGIMINLANMDNTHLVGNQSGTLAYARTTIDYSDGTYNWFIRQTWKAGKMTTEVGREGSTDVYSIEQFNEITGNKFLAEWNYGDLEPLTMFKNKQNYGITDKGDGLSVRNLQHEIDTTFYMNNRELLVNKTRFLVGKNPAEIKAGTKLDITEINEIFDNVGTKDNPVQVMQGDPKNMVYLESIEYMLKKYIIGAGYSVENDFAGSETQIGVLFRGKNDLETTKIKNKAREKQANDLLKNIIEIDTAMNINVYGNNEFNIVIPSFSAIEAEEENTRIDRLIELNMITKRDIIKHYYDVQNDEGEVDRILKEIAKETAVDIAETAVSGQETEQGE